MGGLNTLEGIKALMADMVAVMDEEAEALIGGRHDPDMFKHFSIKKEKFLLEMHKVSAADVSSAEDEFKDLSMILAEKTERNAALLEARMRAVSTVLAALGSTEEKAAGPYALYRVQE